MELHGSQWKFLGIAGRNRVKSSETDRDFDNAADL